MIIFDLINDFSNVGSGSNFSASIMVFILCWSKLLSKDAGILKIRHCDVSLTDISFITSVAYYRHGVSELRVTNYSSICFDYWCCFSMTFINYSSGFSKIWSYSSNLALSLVSMQSSEDEVS